MTLSRFLATLRARLGLALAVFLVTVGSAAAVLWHWPRQYEAVATVLVDPSPPNPLAAGGWTAPRPGFLSTQIDIIRSERVALEVVRRLRLTQDPRWQQAWDEAQQAPAPSEGLFRARAAPVAGAMAPWIAQSLLQSLQVRPARDSEVLSLAVRDRDPAEAARLANGFAEAYIDVQRRLRLDPAQQYSSVFDGQALEARSRMEQAQARLSNFQRERGVVIGDERVDIESARLNDLAARLTGMQAQVAESGSRDIHSRGDAAERAPDVQSSALVAGLRADLARAESRLRELDARLGEQHPQVQDAQAQVGLLRGRLEAETRRVAASAGVTHSIQRQQESQLRTALDTQRALVLRLKAAREEGGVLVREVEAAQRAYDAALGRLNQARLESRTPPGGAHPLTEASAPRLPVSPQPLLHAGLSLGLGALLAVMAVLVLERVDPRLRTPTSVTELLDLPLLGVLPGPRDRGPYQARRTPLVKPWTRGRLPAPVRPMALGSLSKE